MIKMKRSLIMAKFVGLRVAVGLMLRVHPATAYRWLTRILITPLRFSPPPVQAAWMATTTQQSIEVEGQKIQVYSKGEGPAILLSHGWQGRAGQFYRMADALVEQGYRIVAWDWPGHGSSGSKQCHPILGMKALGRVIDEFGPFEAHIAHSVGGLLALAHCVDSEQRINKLVVLSSPTSFETLIGYFFQRALRLQPNPQPIIEHLQEGGELQRLFPSPDTLPEGLELLLIHDLKDSLVAHEGSRQTHRLIPGSRLILTDGLDHDGTIKADETINLCLKHVATNKGEAA